ncbi:MAG: sulfurtransferase TusA family protein [Chloroflexi bacterium]|nr:sulfurtransferase TusA family protein [Chloroflexota bacterium]
MSVADEWDAGDMGCGEVIILLRMRMRKLSPGEVFKLTASDQGAPTDIPAWCRLTGRSLLRAEHPDYWIEQSQRG